MSVGKRIFDNFKEANAYAKSIILSVRKSPLVKRSGENFEVYGEGVTPDDTPPTQIDLNEAKGRLNEIRSLLENSTQETAVKAGIEDFLTQYGNSREVANSLAMVEDASLYEKLEDIHLALEEFIELLDEAAPRSSDEAEYYSKRCFAISNQLMPYKVAARAQKEAREFSEKAKKLPVVIAGQQQWHHKISILNTSGPICRHCTHLARMHIVGERGSELWKCSANNHGTRFLTGEHRKFLAD
jgi:hypothetical protein